MPWYAVIFVVTSWGVSQQRPSCYPFGLLRLDLYISRRILAVAGVLLLLPPFIVTLCLDESKHFFPCMSRMDPTRRLCFVEGVARSGWRGVLFWLECWVFAFSEEKSEENWTDSIQCILRIRGQWLSNDRSVSWKLWAASTKSWGVLVSIVASTKSRCQQRALRSLPFEENVAGFHAKATRNYLL